MTASGVMIAEATPRAPSNQPKDLPLSSGLDRTRTALTQHGQNANSEVKPQNEYRATSSGKFSGSRWMKPPSPVPISDSDSSRRMLTRSAK